MFKLIFHPTVSEAFKNKVNQFVCDWNDEGKQTISNFTSGSTGKAKEILLSKHQMGQSARATGAFFNFNNQQKMLLCLSPDYIAGKMMLVRAMVWDIALFVIEPTAKKLDFPELKRFDFVAMVPLQLEKWLSQIDESVFFRHILLGGAELSPQLEQTIIAKKLSAYLSFGMTETISHIALKKIQPENKYFDAIGNCRFSTNTKNQLLIHAPDLEIEQLVTNDIVELLSPTQFVWKGRLDFVINSGGIKFHPEMLEQKIKATHFENNFFIFGEKDEKLGQKIAICIENDEKMVNKNIIINVLDAYEVPKSWYFIQKIETTHSGKIDRKATIQKLNLSSNA